MSPREDTMHLTVHATARATQRGVPTEIIETIFVFGSEHPAPGRTLKLTLDQSAILLAAEGSSSRQSRLERYRDVYLVVGNEGRVLTVARRRHRNFN